MGASDEEDQVRVEQPRDPVRVDAQQLLGSRAGLAARYPEGLCRAICIGFMNGMRNKECHVKKILELTERTTIGESVGPQSGATGEVDGDEVREGEGGVAADLPGRGPKTRMEGREDEVDRHQQRRRGHGEGVQRRRGRGAIRQHAAAGGVEVPDQ